MIDKIWHIIVHIISKLFFVIFIIVFLLLILHFLSLHHCDDSWSSLGDIDHWKRQTFPQYGVTIRYPDGYKITSTRNKLVITNNSYGPIKTHGDSVTIRLKEENFETATQELKDEYNNRIKAINNPIKTSTTLLMHFSWQRSLFVARHTIWESVAEYPASREDHISKTTILLTNLGDDAPIQQHEAKKHIIIWVDVRAYWPDEWESREPDCEMPTTIPRMIASNIIPIAPLQ